MKKKIISIISAMLSAVLLCSNIVYAEDDKKVYTLTLDDAIKMAAEYSPDMECHEINKTNAKIQLQSAASASKNSQKVEIYASTNFEMNFVKRGYYVEAARSQIALLPYEKTQLEARLAYNTTSLYYNVKNASAVCDIAKSAVERANANKKIIQNQFDLGAATALDVQNADIALMQAKANLSKCENAYTMAQDRLKIQLGIDGECSFNLTDDINVDELNADLDADTASAMNNRYDTVALKENIKLTALYLNIASALSEKGATYYSAYKNNITAQYNYSTGIKNIALLIKDAYFTAVQAGENTKISAQLLDYATKNYEVSKLKSEMGMISSLVLSAASDELTSAQNTYQNALLNEKLAIEKYKYEVAIGL